MSDNKNISMQDRGWNEMQSILDKELPAVKKKRRILPWFIFGTALIAIIAFVGTKDSIGLNFNSNKTITSLHTIDDEKSTETKGNETIEFKNQTVLSSKTNSKNIEKEGLKIEGSNERHLETKEEVIIEFDSPIDVPINQSLTMIDNNVQSFNMEDEALEYSQEEPVLSDIEDKNDSDSQTQLLDNSKEINQSTTKSLQIEKALPTVERTVPSEPLYERSILNPIIKLPFDIPFLNNKQEIAPTKAVKPYASVQRRNSFSPYLFASGNHQSSISGLGYEMGLGLDYNFNKMGIYFEVGYSRTKFGNEEIAADFIPGGSAIEIDGDVIVDEGLVEVNSTSFDLTVNNFSKITSSLSELKFKLGIRRNLTKRLNLNAGLSYSRILSVANKSLLINYTVENTFNDPLTININSSELQNSGAYSSFDVSPYIGMEYEFLPNAFLGLNYNYGLKNLIVDTELDKTSLSSSPNMTNRIFSLAKSEEIYRRNFVAKIRYSF